MIWLRSLFVRVQKSTKSPVVLALLALAGDSFVYMAGAVIIGLGNFVLIPIYTRYLTPAEFGVYALVDVTILVLVTIAQLGLGVSYLKWFADMGEAQRGTLLGSALVAGTSAALLGGSLFTISTVSPAGERWLQGPQDFIWTLLPIVLLENVQAILLTDLRARRKSVAFSTSSIVRLLAVVGASLWFVVLQRRGIEGIFLGRLVGDSIGVFILACLSLRGIRLGSSWPVIAGMVRYGLPLVWSALMGMMLDASGRYFLSYYSTIEQVGLYSVAIKIGNIFQVLVNQPLGVAWGGLMFQLAKWPGARIVYSKILAYTFVVSLAIAFTLALLTPTLFAIFATSAYAPAMAVFPLILIVRAINVMEYPAAIGIYLGGHTRLFALIYSIGLVINLAGNYILVPVHGMFGAAWAWLASWMVIVGLMALIGQRFYPLNYYWRLFAVPILLWLSAFVAGWSSLLTIEGRGLIPFVAAFGVIAGTGILLFLDIWQTQKRMPSGRF